MAIDEVSIIGKPVKDMYGTTIGIVLGTLTHIDGCIQTVGIDCGSEGVRQKSSHQYREKKLRSFDLCGFRNVLETLGAPLDKYPFFSSN